MGKLYCNHRASQKLNTDQIRKETPFPKPSVQDCQGGSHENRCTIQPCCRVYGTELVQRNCKLVNTGGRCLRALKKVENLEMRLPLWQGDHSWALEPKGRIFFGPRPNQCPGHIITQSSQNTKWHNTKAAWPVCISTGVFPVPYTALEQAALKFVGSWDPSPQQVPIGKHPMKSLWSRLLISPKELQAEGPLSFLELQYRGATIASRSHTVMLHPAVMV